MKTKAQAERKASKAEAEKVAAKEATMSTIRKLAVERAETKRTKEACAIVEDSVRARADFGTKNEAAAVVVELEAVDRENKLPKSEIVFKPEAEPQKVEQGNPLADWEEETGSTN